MMTRIGALALLVALGAGEAAAQSGRNAIEREERRIERRIDPNRPSPDGSFVSPDNPDGVVGFDGPPDPMDDGVDQGGPLPPGSPADIDND